MDLTHIEDELTQARQALADCERLERELRQAESSLETERQGLQALSEQFRREDEQVRRLEGVSLVGLIYSVLGSKETRLSEERQELLSVKLKYDNARRRVAALERDVADLRARITGLREHYEALLAEKEQALMTQAGPAAQQLNELANELAEARSQEREIVEAMQAGEMACSGLNRAAKALEDATGWGTWDILGGGMLTSLAKHSRLDEAQAAVQEVQPLLQRFERELNDVDSLAGVTIETGGLAAFADIFMDSLLVDLFVQAKISDSLEAVQSMALRIRDLVTRLSRQREALARQIETLERSRRELLEQSR